jgi:carbonic anhydrase
MQEAYNHALPVRTHSGGNVYLLSKVALAALLLCSLSLAADEPTTTPHAPDAGAKAWERLMAGNRQFMAGGSFCFDDIAGRRATTSRKQSPSVSIVGCADSRVGPELLFHQSLGDLFIVRTAGNVVDTFALASLEYAAVNGWTDIIVVLGHSSCGAVGAALSPADPGTPSLLALVNRIRESFLDIPYSGEPSPEHLRKGVETNARNVANHISAHSPALRELVRSGRIQVIPAYHDLSTGAVTRIE